MPITLNPVSGELDAEVVDDNFQELENFLKEGIESDDLTGKFGKYKIRRYTGGKIVGFNSGAKPYASARATAKTGTFENNWISGTKAVHYHSHKKSTTGNEMDLTELATQSSGAFENYNANINENFTDPLYHPFELLGYPGGSLFYEFQERGFADPDSYYIQNGYDTDGVNNWPPQPAPMGRFPADECWSRWLTIPDAAGGIYVDEPCVAIITATVQGNYFFTPAMRCHGTNTGTIAVDEAYDITGDGTDYIDFTKLYGSFQHTDGVITEGMEHSAFIRLGLFVDTNPIVWDDEFLNGNDFGNKIPLNSGHGFNPWIGSDPDGKHRSSRPDGVAKSRSWVKVTDLTQRVRQRGSYKVVGAIELKGRRRYNFSLKFKPAMSYGFVSHADDPSAASNYTFKNGYLELGGNGGYLPDPAWVTGTDDENRNVAWNWSHLTHGFTGTGFMAEQPWHHSYFFPGGDALVTNLIESSSLSVEFFYGHTLTSLQSEAQEFKPNEDPE